MARKESITKEYLIETAFHYAKNEGLEMVTARKLAARAGCSTQPIFRLYENMEELWKEIFDLGMEYYESFYDRCDKSFSEPFVAMGLAYIKFAKEEPHLFDMLFLAKERYGKSLYEILNGAKGNVGAEMIKAKAAGCRDAGGLFTKMWIFIHGAACMTITGDYDLEEKDTVNMLIDIYKSFTGIRA